MHSRGIILSLLNFVLANMTETCNGICINNCRHCCQY